MTKKKKKDYESISSSKEEDPLLLLSKKKKNKKGLFQPKSHFEDHFSLDSPSDAVHFRSAVVRVFSTGTQQFQLVESSSSSSPSSDDDDDDDDDDDKKLLKAKISSDGSSGLSMLRGCYTLVSVLMMGFLLIFCLQVLLFLFVSLVMEGGLTSSQNLNIFHLLGTILSIPLFVYGLASALTMATEFVLDTWQGHHFFRTILRWNAVNVDWIAFALFLGIPLVVMIYSMFTSEHWWERTALTWFVCITVSYFSFCLAVFVYEIWGALELLSHHPKYESSGEFSIRKLLKRAVLLRQFDRYAGVRHRTFFIEGSHDLPTPNDSYEHSQFADNEFIQERVSLYSKFTQKMPDSWFAEYHPPLRRFNVEDVLDRTVFVTDATWNLEKLFCRRKAARTVLVVNGPSRVTDSQVLSSLVCAILGNTLLVITFAGLVSWGGAPFFLVLLMTGLLVLVNRDAFRRIYVIYDTYRDTRKRRAADGVETSDSSRSEAIYQVTETHRVTQPTEKLCWVLFVMELFGLFVFPLWMLFDVGNKAIAILFLVLGVFSSLRHYFNAVVVLSELGSLDLLDGEFIRSRNEVDPEVMAEEDWREKNRLSQIVGKISQGARRDTWMGVITAFVVIFLFLFLSAFNQGSNSGAVGTVWNILPDFQYVPQEGTFKYPTCSMTADFAIPGSDATAMADYAYLAGIAYVSPESMPKSLDAWFGKGVAYDDVDRVAEFRSQGESHSAVHYKLITFRENPEFAVVTIRGTSNGWDMLSDAQLWSASFLAQAVRTLLPVGVIWNPILENLVAMIAVVQNESLKKVAFYVQTSNFVEWLRGKGMYSSLRVTGHSLGVSLLHFCFFKECKPSALINLFLYCFRAVWQ